MKCQSFLKKRIGIILALKKLESPQHQATWSRLMEIQKNSLYFRESFPKSLQNGLNSSQRNKITWALVSPYICLDKQNYFAMVKEYFLGGDSPRKSSLFFKKIYFNFQSIKSILRHILGLLFLVLFWRWLEINLTLFRHHRKKASP